MKEIHWRGILIIIICFVHAVQGEAREERNVAGYTVITEMVAMRDSIRLATDIAFPKEGNGPWPVLLARTPYGRKGMMDGTLASGIFLDEKNKSLAQSPYVIIIQDTRGRWDSEGKTVALMSEGWIGHEDGYDTIEWIAQQPWCDGDIGMFGASAVGVTQYFAAGSAPPHLKAIVPSFSCSDLFMDLIHPGGSLREEMIVPWITMGKFGEESVEVYTKSPREYNEYWKLRGLQFVADRITVPALHITGWFDFIHQGTLDAYVMMQHESTPGARGRQRLVIGPWPHGMMQKVGDFEFPENSMQPPNLIMSDWFDYWLKEKNTGIFDKPAVDYYVMGAIGEPGALGNEWHSAQDWPVPCTYTPYYFLRENKLSKERPQSNTDSKTYRFDPKDPVPTKGGANLLIPTGPMDQNEFEKRPDVLVFTTEPLNEPVQIIGRVTVNVWASTSCVDTDFTAKLMDVYPDGRSMLITDGIIRGRFSASLSKEELLTPGAVYLFEIDLWTTALIFNKGHRIKVHISSSNKPRFDVNPNTGQDFYEGCEMKVAENTVYFDTSHPSHILLPIVPLK